VQQFVQHFEVWIHSVRGLDFFSSCADSAALAGAPLSFPIRCSYGTGVEGDGDETRPRKVISEGTWEWLSEIVQ